MGFIDIVIVSSKTEFDSHATAWNHHTDPLGHWLQCSPRGPKRNGMTMAVI